MQSDVRRPRLTVTLGGLELPGALSAEIHSHNHFAASRFRVRFAARLVPIDALHVPDQRIEIQIGLGDQQTSQIIGTIDSVHFDPIHSTVDVDGRDLSSILIETQVDETFVNRTASEIAELFASRHGLGALTARTDTPIGRYYQSEHDRVVLGQFSKAMTEWDLLAYLAAKERFDLFLDGDKLCFCPTGTSAPRIFRMQDCINLQFDHRIGLARPVSVTVKSWNSRSAEAVIAKAKSDGRGKTIQRSITRPNLLSKEASELAERVIKDLRRHEWAAVITMPGDLTLDARSQVVIVGTATPWDRVYSIGQLSRHVDARSGFIQRLVLQGLQ